MIPILNQVLVLKSKSKPKSKKKSDKPAKKVEAIPNKNKKDINGIKSIKDIKSTISSSKKNTEKLIPKTASKIGSKPIKEQPKGKNNDKPKPKPKPIPVSTLTLKKKSKEQDTKTKTSIKSIPKAVANPTSKGTKNKKPTGKK